MRTIFHLYICYGILRSIDDTKSPCVDINECDPIGEKCGDLGICLNSPGSYRCHCKPGYVQKSDDSLECEDRGRFEI